MINYKDLFKKHVALPSEHGAWVFLLSPLAIGLFAGRNWSLASLALVVGALAAFLVRQPVSIAVKVYSGRRPRRDLPAALFWGGVYSAAGLAALAALLNMGYAYLLYLAIPGLPVFIWHLVLISRRAERRQIGVEVVASGVLALAATGAYWVGKGAAHPTGWWLFGLAWLQSAASIVYAYVRLEQRTLTALPTLAERLRLGWRALAYSGFNFVAVAGLSLLGVLPELLFLPYALQFAECIYGVAFRPAIGHKPTRIGVRQLILSSLFTLLFILTWR
ncbi:MAG: YwiC-like family protein [Anaerolineales bacterium]|nr:YwiC-like family protein [Anaerolineales bacterium]